MDAIEEELAQKLQSLENSAEAAHLKSHQTSRRDRAVGQEGIDWGKILFPKTIPADHIFQPAVPPSISVSALPWEAALGTFPPTNFG